MGDAGSQEDRLRSAPSVTAAGQRPRRGPRWGRRSIAGRCPRALPRWPNNICNLPQNASTAPVDVVPAAACLIRSFHLRWKQVPDPTHHSRKWAFSLLDTGFRHGPRGPTHESNHKADRFANVRVLATWTLFESEFCPNRFKRLGIRPIQSENFRLAIRSTCDCPTLGGRGRVSGRPRGGHGLFRRDR